MHDGKMVISSYTEIAMGKNNFWKRTKCFLLSSHGEQLVVLLKAMLSFFQWSMHGSILLVTVPPGYTPPRICNFFLSWRSIPHPRVHRKKKFSTPELVIDRIYVFWYIFFIRTNAKRHIFTTLDRISVSLFYSKALYSFSYKNLSSFKAKLKKYFCPSFPENQEDCYDLHKCCWSTS